MSEHKIKPLKVDITKLMTQSKYAQKNGMSKQNVYAMVKAGKLNTIEIDGATLILVS